MKVKKKRGVETPPRIRTFINSVVNTPLESIHTVLSGFHWDYEKGDFFHWLDLINHFDSYLEKFVTTRSDLQLELEDGDEADFPKEAVVQVLRVTRCLLDNCINKSFYNSLEHLTVLLASTDPDIVFDALLTLTAFVKRTSQVARTFRLHRDPVMNGRLFSLSQGWGGKEEGLGLLTCASSNGCDAEACRLGSFLHFEFYKEGESKDSSASGLQVIHIENLHHYPGSDLKVLQTLADQYKVPDTLKFSLLTRIRFARAFSSIDTRRQYVRIRLAAFTALIQSNPDHEDLSAFFNNEPEFVNELVSLLYHEEEVPEDVRVLALGALAGQSLDRPRQVSVYNVLTAGGNCGIIPTLVQKAVASLASATPSYTLTFVEALLQLVSTLVSSSAGCAALREAGLIPILLPLLKDTNRRHVHLVILAVHVLEAFMDYSNPASTLFRDLGGLDDTIYRLKFEVSVLEDSSAGARSDEASSSKGKAIVTEGGASSTPHDIPYQHRVLLKALLRAISLGTYAPGGNARLHGSEENSLPFCLSTIFKHAKLFGGGVFSLAASVMSDLIHRDPTCFPSLDKAGLPGAFLDAITGGVLPSSEAICCIPTSLDAICLNNTGLEAVKERDALRCFVKIFTSKMYLKALANDTPGSLASSLDELMRHVPALRALGIDVCIEILKTIAAMGGAVNVDTPVPMETDGGEERTPEESAPEPSGPTSESSLPEYINNSVRLLETVLQNADTSRLFIEKGGIEALLQLYTLPDLPVSFGGSSTAHNMSITFRAFPPQHATTLTKAVCQVLREDLKVTLSLLGSIAGSRIFDLETGLKMKVLRSLSATECFLSLSAVLVRSSPVMLAELSTGNADILHDIGRVHREVLWQVCLIGEGKTESKKEVDEPSASGGSSSSARENEEDLEALVGQFTGTDRQTAVRSGPTEWTLGADFFSPVRADNIHRRSRREHSSTAEALSQIARLGRLARQGITSTLEVDAVVEQHHAQESSKRKSPEVLNYEMVMKLVLAARSLYLALGKSMVIPSRRRDDLATMSAPAKSVASGIAKVFLENLSFEPAGGNPTVRCRYLGKVVEDIQAVLFDSRRKTCNTVLVNRLFVHGTFAQLLQTFQEVTEMLWTVGFGNMQAENGKEAETTEQKSENHSWLWNTLHSYLKLIEQLVTSSTLLSPTSVTHLLVQPVQGAEIIAPKDVELFVQTMQMQALNAIEPVWNHSSFAECNTTFITSIAGIIRQIYAGAGDAKNRSSSGGVNARLGPAPDEGMISTIVEMGFPRARAEAALRNSETSSVELAMEWLFTHPEEATQEEDELARALALSLGNADGEGEAGKATEMTAEEEVSVRAPDVEKMVNTCINILQMKEAVIFTLTDLLVTISNYSGGRDRPLVISFLVEQLKRCHVEGADWNRLSTISHLLALIISEDTPAREICAKSGLVSVSLEALASYKDASSETPVWVTALCLVLDQMLQFKVVTDASSSNAGASSSGEPQDQTPFAAVLGKPSGYMSDAEREKALTVVCNLLHMPLTAMPLQAVLQLCARLTKSHSLALQFLEGGGLTALLDIPPANWSGFDEVAGAIIRHLLEDPQTLLLAMESEIRHSFTVATARHNGRVSARVFLTTLAPVLTRDPATFMQAAANVCQIDSSGGRNTIVLGKEDRAKDKEKEKSAEKGKEREKQGGRVDGMARVQDRGGKGHKRVPHSFSRVIDQLLEVVLHYPPAKGGDGTSMEIDKRLEKSSEAEAILEAANRAAAAKVSFILKVMTEILLMYSSSVSVVLRRDSESSQGRGPSHAGAEVIGHGGLLYHVVHRILPEGSHQTAAEFVEIGKLSERAAAFLRAVCVRSGEGRRRVLNEIVKALNTAAGATSQAPAGGQNAQPTIKRIHSLVNLIISILLSPSTGNPQTLGFSTDMSKAMVDAGMVRSLTNSLQVVDLDHPDASKVVNAVLRALEVLSRTGSSVEHAVAGDGSNQKEGDAPQTASDNPHLQNDGEMAQNADQQEQINNSMAEDTRPERDNPREAEVFMQEVGEMVFRVNSGGDVGDEEEEEEDEMEVDDGEEEEEDEEEEEEEDEDAEGNDVPHMSPPDTDVEDQDNNLSDDFEDMGDLDGWQGDRVIEVRWTDGLTGLNHVHVLGQTNRNIDLHVETFQNVSMDDIFGSFRQPRGGDRSRVGTYRSGSSTAMARGGTFRHPLLMRPSQNAAQGLAPGSLWSGNTIRDVEAMLNSASDGTRIFMTDQVSDALFGERGALQQAQILDASLDPMLLMGRRGGRGEARLSSWTDDGQQQSGSHSTAVAQAVESSFISRLQALVSSEDQPEAARQAGTEAPSSEVAAANTSVNATNSETQAVRDAEQREPSGIACQTDLDMAVQDVPAGQNSERSQDSGGSGATLGESLRSLEVEIGSADGREENDRQVHSERLEMTPVRGIESASREAHMEVDEDLDSIGVVSQQAQLHVQEDSVQAQATDQPDAGEEITGRNDGSSIDPRFLEALPEDLRAEVLASQQNQSNRNNENHVPPANEEIDPEFLAALPPEIQAEVLEQQHAQRIFQSQQVEGRPVDMDSASIIATFPAELREEVLLTSSEAVLAELSPALLAEAQLLRERAMNNFQTRNLFGGPRLTARRTNGVDRGVNASGSGLFSVGGRRLITNRISGSGSGSKEPEGKALVDEQSVKTLVRLLRLAQPLIKGLLQRLLSNLCAHGATRSALLRLLLDMLRPESEGYSVAISADGAPSQRLYGCQWNVVYARAQLSDVLPPLVSRRVLEVLTHLARNHSAVAKSLLYFEQESSDKRNEGADKGKEKVFETSALSDIPEKHIPVVLFLKLLDRPLYSRSSAHLEQVLGLLEVVTSCTGMENDTVDNANATPSDAQPTDNQQGAQETSSESPQQQAENPPASVALSKMEADILSRLPKRELCNMCRLLAQDGLSSLAYTRVSEVLKKLSDAVPQHRRLFISELADSAHNLSVPAVNELRSLGDIVSSGSSSAGTAILRVLQALSALTHRDAKVEDLLDIIRELNVVMEPLWQQLSICIARIETRLSTSSSSSIVGALGAVTSPLPQGSQKVLDFVEAFFVLCEKLRPQNSDNAAIDLESPPSSTSDASHVGSSGSSSFKSTIRHDERGLNFIRFAEKHRRLLNAFIRQNPGLLEKSFSLLLKSPRLIDFDNKRAYFRSRIRQQHEQQHFGPLRISVRRAYVLEDSYNQLRMRTPDEVKGRLTVQFQGEEGIDAGGLTREWYQLLSRVIFDKGALLFTTVGNESTFQPNPNSVFQTEHLSYFRFVGRVVSKALFDGQLLDVYFTRSFYKHILGSKVTYHDIEAVDPDYYKNLKWLLDNDVSEILSLSFSIDADEEKHILYEKTEVTDYELVPGGRNIRVTEENKHDYVDLVAEHRLTTAIRPQINAFLEGFNELVPRDLISIFNDKELELLISGLPEIDFEDLRANTEYTGYSSGSPVVQWFWEVVQEFSKEDMARLLQFITGTSKVPLEGFKALQGISGPQKFQIHKAYGAPERLPSAHTCFNQLDLPEYSSKDQLHDRLLLAIHEASEGFGFG